MRREGRLFETIIGFAMDLLPILCAVFIVTWAGRAYAEGYGIFVQTPRDKAWEAHTEIVVITEEDAASAFAVGKILEDQEIITSRFAFGIKARLSGYDGMILPGSYILSSDMTMEEILVKISVPTEDTSTDGSGGTGGGNTDEEGPSIKENKDVWGQ